MKQLNSLAVVALFSVCLTGEAAAMPRLQTYIVGSEYHNFYRQDYGSWITNSSSFDLKVVGSWSSGYGGGASYRGGYDFMDCYLMLSAPRQEAGRIWINGNEITSFGDYQSSRPHHPVAFGTLSVESIGRIDNDQANAHDYSHWNSFGAPGWGDEILLNVVVSGYSWTHFDAMGIDKYGRVFTNSCSNDASYYRTYATPEPGTLSLLGLGLLGMIPIMKRKKD